jgi:hypothetical protein
MFNSKVISLAVAALMLGSVTCASAQSDTGVTNEAPNAHSRIPLAIPEVPNPDANAHDGVSNGAPAPATSAYPTKRYSNSTKSVTRHTYNAPDGVNNGAPSAKLKSMKVSKKVIPSPLPAN